MTSNNNNEEEITVFDIMAPITSNGLVIEDPPTENSEAYDIEAARRNTHHLIQKGGAALDDLINLAKQSNDPEAFDSITDLLKALASINKDLVYIQEKKKKLRIDDDKVADVINNNLFVGTTEDMQKMIEGFKKK